jgi:TolB-like protein
MASIIPGFEYDIFISYRQKDNKYDGWVTEFVDNLRKELEATFKEDIRVYFDINLHDGLLETHDVEASLKDKLKCLVFIPILSRTYCDPKSFAWEHEFKAFVEQASQDQFGLKIKLPIGNVTNRVLPVRIHDLDKNDIKLCESVLGGVLRGVEFVYKEPGVNRSLTPGDDEKINLNKTRYRNQINKVALAIKEIVSGLKEEPLQLDSNQQEAFSVVKPLIQEKSIIVLPFENMSPDPDQEYFSDGLTEEVISNLSHISDLMVISRSSAMTFKGTKSSIEEIINKVNVRYVLEGSVRKANNNLRITAQLIDGKNDSHIWAESYNGTLEDVFDIQEKVSLAIVDALKLKLNVEENRKTIKNSAIDGKVHDCFLRARHEIYQWSKESLDRAVHIIHHGLEIYGENALLYAILGEAKYGYFDIGSDVSEKILNEVEEYAKKALSLDPELAQGYKLLSLLERGRGSLIKAYRLMKKALDADPNDATILLYTAYFAGSYMGRPDISEPLNKRLLEIDPLSPVNYMFVAIDNFMKGEYGKSVEFLQKSNRIAPDFFYSVFWLPTFLFADDKREEALSLIEKIIIEDGFPKPFKEMTLFIKYSILGEKPLAQKVLSEETKQYTWHDPDFSYTMPFYYSLVGDKEQAFIYLEHAIDRGFINYPSLSGNNPFLDNIRGDARFKKLLEQVKDQWENFEV